MHRGFKMVRDMVKLCPLPLSSLTDKKLLAYAESLLPYSTGIEVECHTNDGYLALVEEIYRKIPNIMQTSASFGEQRFRIPPGIKGLICLYEICETLKSTCTLNPDSGIHYHIDFTDTPDLFKSLNSHLLIKKNNNWVMKALKSWNYTGKFNRWEMSHSKEAVKIHFDYQTIEYRIGEMTFDYELMIKRILHCQNISRKLKDSLKSSSQITPVKTKLPKVIGRIQL